MIMDEDLNTSLCNACCHSSSEIVMDLINQGANPNCNESGLTPLGWALCASNREDILNKIKILVEAGADLNITGSQPSLYLAGNRGLSDIGVYLVNNGCDPYALGENENENAIDNAKGEGNLIFAEKIIEAFQQVQAKKEMMIFASDTTTGLKRHVRKI